jgi:glycosyltransferase involved in cell wall biosynthesis
MTARDTILVDMTPMLPGAINGGAKILVLELLRRLPILAPDKHFVLLTRRTSHDELAPFERANVTRELVWDDAGAQEQPNRLTEWVARQDIGITRRLPGWLRRARYDLRRVLCRTTSVSRRSDVVPTFMFSPFGLSEGFRASEYFVLDLPTVAILYDLQHRAYPQFFDDFERTKRERNFQRHRASSVLGCISDFVRDTAIDAGVPPEAAVRIHIMLKHRLAQSEAAYDEPVLESLGLRPNGYLLYPANFWAHKNHDQLLEAFARARRDGLRRDLKLVCTGAPGGVETVKLRAETLGVGDAFVHPGFLDSKQFSALLRGALGVVFPSLYEGFGMPVIEAMAAGRPVACSNSTSVAEVAGGAALLFDPNDPADIAQAICKLASDAAVRASLIEKGTQRADAFADTDLMAREYLELFELAADRWSRQPRTGDAHHVGGVYGDGWATPQLAVRYGHGSADRVLRLVLEAPGMDAIRRYELAVRDGDGAALVRDAIAPGGSSAIDVPIGPEAGVRNVRISPFFRPAELHSGSADVRKLTVMVRKIEICEPGKSSILFPAAGAA